MYYSALCEEGVVIVSDTRVLHDYQASHEPKFHLLYNNKVLITGAGSNIVIDYVIEDLNEKEISAIDNSFSNIVKTIEDSVTKIKSKYYRRMGEEYDLELLVTG